MWKQIIVAILVIIVAVTGDTVYQEVVRVAVDTSNNFRLGRLLFYLRPVVFTLWYLPIVIVARWFMTGEGISPLLSPIFIILGSAVLSITVYPSLGHIFGDNVYITFVGFASSRWALTAQSGAFLIAIGIVRLLWPAHKKGE